LRNQAGEANQSETSNHHGKTSNYCWTETAKQTNLTRRYYQYHFKNESIPNLN
jgi:hypothetical protein